MSHPSFWAAGMGEQDTETQHSTSCSRSPSQLTLTPASPLRGVGKCREHPALHGLPELGLSSARSSLRFGSAVISLACPEKQGVAHQSESREKSNERIFILAVQLLLSRPNRCGESLESASRRSWELLGQSSLTLTRLHRWKQGLCRAVHTYLGGHHLCVGATDLHPRVKTCLVVGLHDVTPIHLICSNPTVIGAWKRKRSHHPSQDFGSNDSTAV